MFLNPDNPKAIYRNFSANRFVFRASTISAITASAALLWSVHLFLHRRCDEENKHIPERVADDQRLKRNA